MLLSTFEKSNNKQFVRINKSETLPSIHFNDISLYIELPRCTHSIELPSFIEVQLLKSVVMSELFLKTHTFTLLRIKHKLVIYSILFTNKYHFF